MAVEKTLILIKPDAVRRGLAAEILGRIEARGFTVRAGKLLTASRELGETHYAEHNEKPFYGELVDFITSGPTWALVVEGEGAIATMRKTIGATNPADAEPGSIRGDLAMSMPDNLVHGSDSPESAEREIALWFFPPMSSAEPDSVAANVAQWTATNAEFTDAGAEAWWLNETIVWGVCGIADEWLGDVAGLDVVELGCGTAHCAARLARAQARARSASIRRLRSSQPRVG